MQRFVALLALALAGCGPGGPFDLRLTFPDEAARATCASLHLWVLTPGAGASCAPLADGAARPGDPGYEVEVELNFAYPPPADAPTLGDVGPGPRLFFAEGEDGYGQVFLHGCTAAEAGSGGPSTVIIALARTTVCTPVGAETCNLRDDDCDEATDEGAPADLCPAEPHAVPTACQAGVCAYDCTPGWLDTSGTTADGCECRQTRLGVEWCDGLDNDCDGSVDEGGCQACATDADCAAPADCLGGACQAGTCQSEPIADGSPCDDLDPCTSGDTCQDGACQGAAYTCDDGLWCNGSEACDGLGGCANPGPPCNAPCARSCDEETDTCRPDEAGTGCDDGVSCTADDACDGAGGCAGVPLDGYCGPGEECLPACAGDALGCVRRPDYLTLTCPAEAPAAEAALCRLQAVNAEGTERCARCSVSLLPSLVATALFGQCELGDWAMEETGCASTAYCDLGASDQACCQTLACAMNPQGLLLSPAACSPGRRGYRLSRLVDFQPFSRARFCYDANQQPDGSGAVLQVQVDPGDDMVGTLVACHPPSSFDAAWFTRACAELPRSVTDMSVTRLTLRAEAGNPNDFAVLGDAAVWAFPPGCDQETEIMRTHFEGCDPSSDSFEGWSFSGGGPTCESGSRCGFSGGLLLGSGADGVVPQLSATYSLTGPHAGIRFPAELCWSHYVLPGFTGSYSFSVSGGGGAVWQAQVYESQFFQISLEGECREQCVDLSHLGPNLYGSAFLSLHLQGDAEGATGFLLINDVVLRSSQQCPADSVLAVGMLDTTLEPPELPVQNLTGLPRRARVECTWGGDGPSTYAEIEFR